MAEIERAAGRVLLLLLLWTRWAADIDGRALVASSLAAAGTDLESLREDELSMAGRRSASIFLFDE